MRTLIIATTLIGMSIATAASADVPGKNWISSAKASKILAARGFRVTKIEADDGHWEGEARKGRVKYEFHINPHSGQVTKLERDRD